MDPDPPFVVPVDDPVPDVPVVLLDEELPVPVPVPVPVPDESDEPVEPDEPVELLVPEPEVVGDWVDVVDPGVVEVGVSVGVVDEPSPPIEPAPSAGALGLTPPPLITVAIPPLGRTLTLV